MNCHFLLLLGFKCYLMNPKCICQYNTSSFIWTLLAGYCHLYMKQVFQNQCPRENSCQSLTPFNLILPILVNSISIILVAYAKNHGKILESCFFLHLMFNQCTKCCPFPQSISPRLATSYNYHSYKPCPGHSLICLDYCGLPSPESVFYSTTRVIL